MLKLIVNADDLGLTPGCNAGILQAMTQGIVTDTTLMVSAGHAAAAVKLLRASGFSAAGLHLNLTSGTPALPAEEIPDLVDQNGRFFRIHKTDITARQVRQARRELTAQIDRFLATGLTLTHLDTHHHIHMHPALLAMVIGFAKDLKVPMRQANPAVRDAILAAGVKTTEHFSMSFYGTGAAGAGVTEAVLQSIIQTCQGCGVLEIMCHPAAADPETYRVSSYNALRETELATLTNPALKARLAEWGATLTNYEALIQC